MSKLLGSSVFEGNTHLGTGVETAACEEPTSTTNSGKGKVKKHAVIEGIGVLEEPAEGEFLHPFGGILAVNSLESRCVHRSTLEVIFIDMLAVIE